MVIKLEEALKKLTNNEQNELISLEKEIDKAITEDFDGNEIYLGDFEYSSERVFQKLKEKYREAGWTLKYESDQRDGDFLRITPRRRR